MRTSLTSCAVMCIILLLSGFAGSGSASAFREKPDWESVYIIGIIEPYNRTEIAGRLEIGPLFVERMEKLFTEANYRVVRISNEMLYQDGFSIYHEAESDTPLEQDQIIRLSEKYKLDALVTGNIFYYQKRSKSEFFHMKEFWKISVEGLVFSGKTGKPLLKVPLEKEERVYIGPSSPPWQKQILDTDIKTVTELGSYLLASMGEKPRDTEPPLIDIKKPLDAQISRTTVTLVLGEITDRSKVYSLSINGEDKNITPDGVVKLYYPVTYIYGKEKEPVTLSLLAKDIYDNTATRTIGLIWGRPLWGVITKVGGKEILIDMGSAQGVAVGMTFMACNVETYRDPITGRNMFNFVEVGPVYVKRVYSHKSECTFINPEKAERMKKGDIVR